jgi:hypothetical protein
MSEITRINRAARWLMELASELESIYNSSVGEKYKIMLLMTYIDILSKIWQTNQKTPLYPQPKSTKLLFFLTTKPRVFYKK